jgi:acetylornithine deacetylase/succinyl-diaminopimelate desuccinylase-like protein
MLGRLLNPSLTDSVIRLMRKRGESFHPLFHNTVSPTMLHGSTKINVIPSEVTVELDGRLLPGNKPEDMIRELQAITWDKVEFELVRSDDSPEEIDMGLFDTLAGILREADPSAAGSAPLLLPAVTDGRFFKPLGIQTYGFLPMQLPDDIIFTDLIHARDERIPAETVEFGTRAISHALARF